MLNGTDVAGPAATTAELLEAHGFGVAEVGDAADKPIAATRVVHGAGLADDAGLLAEVFGDAKVREQAGGAPLSLVLGDLDHGDRGARRPGAGHRP